jgi:hypothetical protein
MSTKEAVADLFLQRWNVEMLMEGVDTLLVPWMAGTSVLVIEKVYGHFRNQSFQHAQALLDAWHAKQGGCS